MENKSIVQWCKEQHEAGNELTLKWDGGNDSGWVHFEVDGEGVDNEYTRALVNRMDDVLDYGSWAGEFQASGQAIYDPESNSFTGVDYYGEDENDVEYIDISITVPKKLWFDTLHVEVECNYDEGSQTSVRFLIKNGFLTTEHTDFCSNLEEELVKDFDDVFNNYQSGTNDKEFRSCTDSWILDREVAVESGDDLIFYIKQVEFSVMDNVEKNVVLELDEETAAAIDEQLNDVEDEN
jgi:hypothetical protein